jgi:hypothetical protein
MKCMPHWSSLSAVAPQDPSLSSTPCCTELPLKALIDGLQEIFHTPEGSLAYHRFGRNSEEQGMELPEGGMTAWGHYSRWSKRVK